MENFPRGYIILDSSEHIQERDQPASNHDGLLEHNEILQLSTWLAQ